MNVHIILVHVTPYKLEMVCNPNIRFQIDIITQEIPNSSEAPPKSTCPRKTVCRPASTRPLFAHKQAPCIFCWKTFANMVDLVMHLKEFHRRSSYYVCCICTRSFKFQSAIVKHYRIAHRIGATYDVLKRKDAFVMPLNCDTHPLIVSDHQNQGW